MHDFEKLRELEREIYPSDFWGLQDVHSIEDLADYLECRPNQVIIIMGDDWYLLASKNKKRVEIADLASVGKFNVLQLASFLKSLKGCIVTMDAREATSYPLIKKYCSWKNIQVLKDEPWQWGYEIFHEMKLKL